jgi:hypothetical protein
MSANAGSQNPFAFTRQPIRLALRFQKSLPTLLLLLPALCSAAAATPPALSDNFGDSVTIDATGTATCVGTCTTILAAAASPGDVTWAGTLGVFHVSAGGQSKPALPPSQLSLAVQATTGSFSGTTTSATLTATFSDVGFNFSGAGPLVMVGSYSLSGSASVTGSGHADSSNTLFGTETAVGTIGPFTSSQTGTITGPVPPGIPFSMTETVVATLGPNSSLLVAGLNMAAPPPPPLGLSCPTASGQLDLPYDSYFVPSGGYPPYSFAVDGMLPPGLILNPSTGELSGTPAMAGPFSVTPQVVDSSDNPALNTGLIQCSILITPAPAALSLACPAPSDQTGFPYASSLVGTGGNPPYTFFITSGSLPPGLSLNPSTGAITGTDAATTGSFAFMGGVTDSSNGANKPAAANCMLLAQAPKLTMVEGKGTTPQDVVVGMSPATPLSVVVTNVATGKPVKGVTVTFEVRIETDTGTFNGGETIIGPNQSLYSELSVMTNAEGIATAPFTAAKEATGLRYAVFASAPGADFAGFELTNVAGLPAKIGIVSGAPQAATVLTMFAKPLVAKVTDNFGNPVSNYFVVFLPPSNANAPAATFVAAAGMPGATPTASALTTKAGIATSSALFANTFAGEYGTVAAVVAGPTQLIPLATTTFTLTNVAGLPAKIGIVSGTPQAATVLTMFAKPLVAKVTDQFGNPVPNYFVVFLPASKANAPGATFVAAAGDPKATPTASALTTKEGIATSPALFANMFAGEYGIVAAVVAGPAQLIPLATTTFTIFNLPGAPAMIYRIAPTGKFVVKVDGVSKYFAVVGTRYNTLTVQVTDKFGNGISDVKVKFTTVVGGAMEPGAAFPGGTATNPTPKVCNMTTDANGYASACPLTANGTTGSFAVTASVTGIAPASFSLTNIAEGQVPVPNVVGLMQAAATTAIKNSGLALGTVKMQASKTVAAGIVSSQMPAAGTAVKTGSMVGLTVSTGPP